MLQAGKKNSGNVSALTLFCFSAEMLSYSLLMEQMLVWKKKGFLGNL